MIQTQAIAAPMLKLPPNRVRRNYMGGAGLDRLEGRAVPRDGDRPEDWVASLVEARNPGLDVSQDEGLSTVELGGQRFLLRDLVNQAPEHYLGEAHLRQWGTEIGFLAKLLDSSMRLHIQAHPTRAFAKKHYGQPWGKFETYVILAVRSDCDPYIYLGFQHPPSAEEWLRIVTEQDIPAMEACFERVPVAVGQVWYVPGGLPHALGEGLTVLEVMEPSDLVVRCEFEREGIMVPPPARFMGQAPSEALKLIDHTEWSIDRLRSTYLVSPRVLVERETFRESLLIGPEQIDCFEIRKWEINGRTRVRLDDRFVIAIVDEGHGHLAVDDGVPMDVRKGEKLFVSAAAHELTLQSSDDNRLVIYVCQPGKTRK